MLWLIVLGKSIRVCSYPGDRQAEPTVHREGGQPGCVGSCTQEEGGARVSGVFPATITLSSFSAGAGQGVAGSSARQPGPSSTHGPVSATRGLLLLWARGWAPGLGLQLFALQCGWAFQSLGKWFLVTSRILAGLSSTVTCVQLDRHVHF